MTMNLIPLFESHARFVELMDDDFSQELPAVIHFIESFSEELRAIDGYRAIKAFLAAHAGTEETFSSYRTYVERLLLWALLVHKKPLFSLTHADCRCFMQFCVAPPPDWVGTQVKARFIRLDDRVAMPTDIYVVNPKWRPFQVMIPKHVRKLAQEDGATPTPEIYQTKQHSVDLAYRVCGNFFNWMTSEGLSGYVNPFRGIKAKPRVSAAVANVKASFFTTQQWDFVLETAVRMADKDSDSHERTLFIVTTLHSMYLKVADLVGDRNRRPNMGDFHQDDHGEWWFDVVSKDPAFSRVSVSDAYMSVWMARYRRFLDLPPVPPPGDCSPLLTTKKGCPGLSAGYIRRLVQDVFDHALARMKAEGHAADDVQAFRTASLHWLRDTSAKTDAKVRNRADLQRDLRHAWPETTLGRYYPRDDNDRHRSNKHLSILGFKDED